MKRYLCLLIVTVFIAVALNGTPDNKFSLGLETLGYPLLSGPSLTMELPFDNLRYHLNARFGIGIMNIVRESYTDYYSIGLGANYFFNGRGNGLYSGATVEYARARYMYKDYLVEPILWTEKNRDINSVALLANLGYNWEYPSNFYLRLGSNVGAKFAKNQDTFLVVNPQFIIGYSF